MKSVVVFVSRPHGLQVLDSLIDSQYYKILLVYTHQLNPKSQDPKRNIRSDYHLFENKCKENKIKLISIDSPKEEIKDCPDCDLIIEVSWRYLIPKIITSKAKIAAFGIHRGKLPEYAGAEPIKKALQNGEKEIFISAHYLSPKIDQGNVICTEKHNVNYNLQNDLENNVQRLRDEITPFFSKIMFKAIKMINDDFQNIEKD